MIQAVKWLNNVEDRPEKVQLIETVMALIRFPLMSGKSEKFSLEMLCI